MTTSITGPHVDVPASPQPEVRSAENPQQPLTFEALARLIGDFSGPATPAVTPRNSIQVAAVFACVRAIAEAIARVPCVVFRRTADGTEKAREHPLYRVLKTRPNPTICAFTFWCAMITHRKLWGNAYAEIVRDRRGRPVQLVLIEPWRVTPKLVAGEIMYDVLVDGGTVRLLQRDMIHLMEFTLDGVVGISVVGQARLTIAAAKSNDGFAAGLAANNMRPGGVLTHPGKLSDASTRRLRESWHDTYVGPHNVGKPLILEEGMKYESYTMPLEEAEWVASNKFRVAEICRWFDVPPARIHEYEGMPNAGLEESSRLFLANSCAPIFEAVRQELDEKLILPEEREEISIEHLTQILVQMDTEAQMLRYRTLTDIGAVGNDAVCDWENINRPPDGRGKVHYVSSAKMPAPTPEAAERLMEAWIAKGLKSAPGGANGPGDESGQPNPKTDDQVART